jgi:hypothetical protein
MLCKYPTAFNKRNPELVSPCGNCLPCRINKRRIWAHRIVLESHLHNENSFLTLTYNDDNLPQHVVNPNTGECYAPLSVDPEHHRLFMHRLRKLYFKKTGKTVRFFAVGEYGEKSGRPHYHYALFGFPHTMPELIREVWPYGNIMLGTLTYESASYVAGYVTKKLTTENDYTATILQGRHPEFARQSRRPGIGKGASEWIAEQLKHWDIKNVDDIPKFLLHGSKQLPLGRYLIDSLYKELEVTFEDGEREKLYKRALRSLHANHLQNSPHFQEYSKLPLDIFLEKVNEQKITNLESRVKLFTKEKKI